MSAQTVPAPQIPGAIYQSFLAKGGFANVYLYQQEAPRRAVAVKVLNATASEHERQRFITEANVMAMMSTHPAVVPVYAIGTAEGGRNYLMMEYCPIVNVGKLYPGKPFPVVSVLDVGIQIAGALESLHRLGYVHKDIKPANILVTSFHKPVLADFGIASPMNAVDLPAEYKGASPPWSPPEQLLDSQPADASADVYALAATLYTLLAGRSPHVDPSGAKTTRVGMLERAQMPYKPPIGRADVPAALERTLMTALSAAPRQRYRTALSFAHALQQIQSDMHLPVTQVDICQDAATPLTPADDDDATVIRPITIIDPLTSPGQGGGSGSAQWPLASPGAAPRAGAAAPSWDGAAASRAELASAGDTLDHSPTRPSGAASPAALSAAAVPASAGAAGAGASPMGAPSPLSASSRASSQVTPARTPPEVAESPTPGTDSSEPVQRGRSRRLLVGAVALGTLVALVGAGGYALFNGTTVTREKEPETSTPQAASADMLGLTSVAPPQDVTVSLDEQAPDPSTPVLVTWEPQEAADHYLYRLADPQEPGPVAETTQTQVYVPAVPGRTCVEVVAVSARGAQSSPVVTCTATP